MLRSVVKRLTKPKDPKVVWCYIKFEVEPKGFDIKSKVARWAVEYLSGAAREEFIDEYAAKMRKATMECEIKNAAVDRLATKIEKASR